VGAKGSKSKGGFEAVATEDKHEAKQAADVAVAQGAMGEDEVKTDQNLMKEQMEATQIPHQEFFKKTRRVDKLFARLYSRRKKLLSKLEDVDTNNNGFTSWDEWWYAVRTLAANLTSPHSDGIRTTYLRATAVSQTRAASASLATLDRATAARRAAVLLSYRPRELQMC
jgi:hypothetical protein